MTPNEAKKIWTVLDSIWAQCHGCGHTWKMKRGDAFLCPSCSNEPAEVQFSGAGTYLHLPEELPEWSAWKL